MSLDATAHQEFATLCEDRLDYTAAAAWDTYYARMAPWLNSPDAAVRSIVVNRLATAVFSAEPMASRRYQHQPLSIDAGRQRPIWLLDQIIQAQRCYADILPLFLQTLHHHGDDERWSSMLCLWLQDLKTRDLPGIDSSHIEGTLILLGAYGATWEAGSEHWLTFLDHPASYVRACAARMLAKYSDAATAPTTDQLFMIMQAKEFIRPGVAGPFWSEFHYGGYAGIDVTDWMMTILEQRPGPEPDDLPCNGIDFYLHELCDGSVDVINRMIAGGHLALAVEAATETLGRVEGMHDILMTLGDLDDRPIAQQAWHHLARYYHVVHPQAQQSETLHATSNWRPGIDRIILRQGSGTMWRDVLVLYPAVGEDGIADQDVWPLLEQIMPAAMRGPLLHEQQQEARRSYEYASGVLLSLEGNHGQMGWARVELIGRGVQDRWDPYTVL